MKKLSLFFVCDFFCPVVFSSRSDSRYNFSSGAGDGDFRGKCHFSVGTQNEPGGFRRNSAHTACGEAPPKIGRNATARGYAGRRRPDGASAGPASAAGGPNGGPGGLTLTGEEKTSPLPIV